MPDGTSFVPAFLVAGAIIALGIAILGLSLARAKDSLPEPSEEKLRRARPWWTLNH